jgi:uncharacterized protein
MASQLIPFNIYLRNRFSKRVQRVALHAGMTCPNRDGSKGTAGCIYCNNNAFNPFVNQSLSIKDQLEIGADRIKRKHGDCYLLPYFQTYSNTYAPVEVLESLYKEALNDPSVIGLMISTRPDCIDTRVLDLLKEINLYKMIWIELGIQTAHDATLEKINRRHTWNDSVQIIL